LIEYAETEEKNMEVFDSLLLSIDFKAIDEDVLEKFVKKSKDKWLKKNSVWKKKIKEIENEDSEKSENSESETSEKSESESDSDSDEKVKELNCKN
jgi:hypothetical protein